MKSIKSFISGILLIFLLVTSNITCMDQQGAEQYECYLAHALPEAISAGKLELVKKLLLKGALLNSQEVLKALWTADANGYKAVVRFLLDKNVLELFPKSSQPEEILKLAIRNGHSTTVQTTLKVYKKLKVGLDRVKMVLITMEELSHQAFEAQEELQYLEERRANHEQESAGLEDLFENFAPSKELNKKIKAVREKLTRYNNEIAQYKKIFVALLDSNPAVVHEEDNNGVTLLYFVMGHNLKINCTQKICDLLDRAEKNKAFARKDNQKKEPKGESPKLFHKMVKGGKTSIIRELVREPESAVALFEHFCASPEQRAELYKLLQLFDSRSPRSQRNGRKYNFDRKRTAGVQEILTHVFESNPAIFDGQHFLNLVFQDNRQDIIELLARRFKMKAMSLEVPSATEMVELLISHGAQATTDSGDVELQTPQEIHSMPALPSIFTLVESTL